MKEVVAQPDQNLDWYSPKKSAAVADCGVKVIYAAIRQKKLRAAVIGGGRIYRIHKTWIREWLERSAEPIEIK